MSSMHIVLVDPLGDVLFSGKSVIAHGAQGRGAEALPETLPTPIGTPIAAQVAAIAAAPDSSEALTEPEFDDEYGDLDSEPCPETMRSAGSGVYRAVDRTSYPSPLRKVG